MRMVGPTRKFLFGAAGAWAVIWMSVPGIVSADEEFPLEGTLQIEEATATPALKKTCTTIRLRIENSGLQAVSLLRMRSPAAPTSRIVARIGDRHITELESIHIAADEVLDLKTSHLRFELCDLKVDLEAGETFPASLVFSIGELPIEIHVHVT